MALRSAATLFAALLLVAAAAPALADIEVLSSDVPGLAVGTRLPDGTVLSVPAGRSLRLLGPDGSTTYLVVGPYDGKLEDYQRRLPCSWWQKLIRSDCPDDSPSAGVGGTRGTE